MDLGIANRRALVTGAAGGIGRATASLLREEGARLSVTDLDADAVRTLRRELDCTGAAADLSGVDGIERLLDELGRDFDIVVHAAGVTGAKGDPLTIADSDWRHALDIDFLSGVRLARAVGPGMIERGWGRLVFVTSENVAQPYPEESVYNASKSALLSFAKSVAMQHSGSGLLCNCVAPAFIETNMTDGMMRRRADELGVSMDEAIRSFLAEKRPHLVLGRRGRPEEVASVIALLCSERGSFVTGSNWRVDGGAVASIEV